MKIAAIQMASGPDRERNLGRAADMARLAAEKGAKLAAFPEIFALPWFPATKNEEHFALAETVDGPTVSRMRDVAKELGLVLVCPFFEAHEEEFYNSCAVIEKDGSLVGTYRKVHIPQVSFWEEKFYFAPGDGGFPVFETSCGTIGVQLSWDNFFPEGSRILGLSGVQIVVAPTSAAFSSQDRWIKVISANAIVNGFFVLRVNRVGREECQTFYGESFCVNPFGEQTGETAADRDAVYVVEADLALVDEARRLLPFFPDRRPGCYDPIISSATLPAMARPLQSS